MQNHVFLSSHALASLSLARNNRNTEPDCPPAISDRIDESFPTPSLALPSVHAGDGRDKNEESELLFEGEEILYQPEPLPTSDESSYVSCNPCSVGARQVSLSSPSVSASAPATASTPVSAIDELAASLAAVDLAALTRAAAAPVDGALLDRFVESVENNAIDVVRQMLTQNPSLASAVHPQTGDVPICHVASLACLRLLLTCRASPSQVTGVQRCPVARRPLCRCIEFAYCYLPLI